MAQRTPYSLVKSAGLRQAKSLLVSCALVLSIISSTLVHESASSSTGTDFAVASGSGDQSIASAAYNSKENEYLVAFENTGVPGWGSNSRATGHIIKADGSLGSSDIFFSPTKSSQIRPVVVFNSVNNEYFVAWKDSRDSASRGANIYAHRVLPNGTLVGSDIRVSNGPGNEQEFWVTYNSANNQYFVGWRDTRNQSTNGTDIYGQIVNANGLLFGQEIAISKKPSNQDFQHVVYNSAANNYLVVWRETVNSATMGSDIYGQLVDSKGKLIGNEIQISIAKRNQDRPVATYNSKLNEFFVSWPDGRNPSPDIYGARVSAGGKVQSDLPISNASGTQMRPENDYNSVDNEYLVVWSDDRNLSQNGYDLYGQILAGRGARIGSEILISNALGDQTKPIVTYNSNQNQYLVVWTDNRNSNYDIYGQIINADPTQTLPTGKIMGQLYNDANGNLVRDVNEVGMANWNLTLYKNANALSSALTTADGSYLFDNVTFGTFTLSAIAKQLYIPTQPLNNSYAVAIDQSHSMAVRDFGFFKNPASLTASLGDLPGLAHEGIETTGNLLYYVDVVSAEIKTYDANGVLVLSISSQGSFRPTGISIDSENNIWASSYSQGIIKKLDSQGNLLLQVGSQGNLEGQFAAPRGLTVDQDDNVYVADSNNHRIQKFDKDGNYLMTIGAGGGLAYAYLVIPFDVTVDSAGNIFVADTGNNRIQKFDAQGDFVAAFGTAGSGLAALNAPRAIAMGPDDEVIVADTYKNRIVVFDNNGKFLRAFGNLGADPTEFGNPSGLTLDPEGDIYVAELSNDRIQILNNDGTFMSIIKTRSSPIEPYFTAIDSVGNLLVSDGHNNKILVFDPDNGTLLSQFGELGTSLGEFHGPRGIAVNTQGQIFVVDYLGNRIQKFDSEGNYLSSFGSQGTNPGQFKQPRSVVFDSSGNILVSDLGNNRIQKFDQNGNFLAQFGADKPYQIALDSQDNVYVAEESLNRVEKFDSLGNSLLLFGSLGSGPGEFDNNRGVAISVDGDIYVADTSNNRIQKFDENGNFISMFGSSGSDPGQFRQPRALMFDGSGNLWVADASNFRLQEFDSDGNFIREITYVFD
jgi:sugar lactone lactonase YvrE